MPIRSSILRPVPWLCMITLVPCCDRVAGADATAASATASGAATATATSAMPAPGTYEKDGAYLTIDRERAVIQQADGTGSGFRLVRDPGRINLYRNGSPSGISLETSADGVSMSDGTTRQLYKPCPAPPDVIGWAPFALPAGITDPVACKTVADELQRRFDLEQRLRKDAIAASGGRLDAATLARPDLSGKWQQIIATDTDNEQWLLATLRKDGWIDAKHYGNQAHVALLLILLHNIQYLRLGATAQEQMRAEFQRHEIDEMSLAGICDRFALVIGDPLSYGVQGSVDAQGRTVLPIIADAARVDANRARLDQPPLGTMGATVLRIGADGRLVGEGAAPLTGLYAIDLAKANQDPAWGLAEAAKADPALGKAIAAARVGDPAAVAAWVKAANPWLRQKFADLLLTQGNPPAGGGDAETAALACRPLFEGYLTGAPASDEWQRLMVANLLAYVLAARAVPPTAEELARCGSLAGDLESALARTDIASGIQGANLRDTLACVRFRQGRFQDAATQWQKAIAQAGASDAAALFKRRLAAAQAVPPGPLPRE
jgi:hypothetical protein